MRHGGWVPEMERRLFALLAAATLAGGCGGAATTTAATTAPTPAAAVSPSPTQVFSDAEWLWCSANFLGPVFDTAARLGLDVANGMSDVAIAIGDVEYRGYPPEHARQVAEANQTFIRACHAAYEGR
jgi:hypothetical protein